MKGYPHSLSDDDLEYPSWAQLAAALINVLEAELRASRAYIRSAATTTPRGDEQLYRAWVDASVDSALALSAYRTVTE